MDVSKCVKECITEDNDELQFIEKSGISVESFIELLSFYLKSTFITWKGKVLLQKAGVCIGSRVAPILSDIFLGKVDTALQDRLPTMVKGMFRFVDDYLIFLPKSDGPECVTEVLSAFQAEGRGLCFTKELPSDNRIRVDVGFSADA